MPLRLEEVGFAFSPASPVLRACSASFPDATLTAVVGPNGAGKSTLLRILAGSLRPDRGSVLLGSRPVLSLSRHERAARIAYVPQRSMVAFPFAVREVVRLGRYLADRSGNALAVDRAIRRVGLADRADDPFGQLSAGQQQRATLARALAQLDLDPDDPRPLAGLCLLLDEPVSAMDPPHALATLRLLRTLADRGLCAVIVLHDLSLALRFANRSMVLSADGRVITAGPVADSLAPDVLRAAFDVDFTPLADPADPARTAALLPTEPDTL